MVPEIELDYFFKINKTSIGIMGYKLTCIFKGQNENLEVWNMLH